MNRCREIASSISWECEVTRFYFEDNAGIGARSINAISDVLKIHDGVLILEDDCIPKAGAYEFLAAAITQLDGNPRIASIGTFNPIGRTPFLRDAPLSLSTTFRGWGPYLKRRHWEEYKETFSITPLGALSCLSEAAKYPGLATKLIKLKMLLGHRKEPSHADRYMNIFFRSRGYLSAVPRENLLDNIGFGERATNTVLLPGVKIPLKGDLLNNLEFAEPVKIAKRIDRLEGWFIAAWAIGRIIQGKRFTAPRKSV